MTSGNLQRWISPFPWNLNKKGDCETYRGSWSTGVEYYSMCISLVFGSLNDVVGNIKSSIGLCALIWIVKATLAVNRMQQRKMDITHPADCETDQWIFDQRKHLTKDFQLKSATACKHTKSEETAFVSGTNTCTMSAMYENVLYHMYDESNICRHTFSSCKRERNIVVGYRHSRNAQLGLRSGFICSSRWLLICIWKCSSNT